MQDCSNSIAKSELLQSCTKPSIYPENYAQFCVFVVMLSVLSGFVYVKDTWRISLKLVSTKPKQSANHVNDVWRRHVSCTSKQTGILAYEVGAPWLVALYKLRRISLWMSIIYLPVPISYLPCSLYMQRRFILRVFCWFAILWLDFLISL